ncbi:Uncharacterised protein [Mycobacteroides abscessus subsp. abscessus]|nr:Uncharacterised protein [Mycobacteroides abscessus subsp. abscessus]
MRVFLPSIDMKLQELLMAKCILGREHLLNRVFNETSWVIPQEIPSDFMFQTTWMLAVVIVNLV